jgi:rod shape determining protein RodA
MKNQSVSANLDWTSVVLYAILAIMGWFTIYSSSSPIEDVSFDIAEIYGRQLIFIFLSIPIIIAILWIDSKIYEKFAFLIYVGSILLLAGLFVFGKTIKGQTNWYQFAGFNLQPSEFAKIATALLLSKVLSDSTFNLNEFKNQLIAFVIILAPVSLILMQPDAGSAMIFLSLVIVLYREGLPDIYMITILTLLVLSISALIFDPIYITLVFLIIMIVYFFSKKRIQRKPILNLIFFGVMTFCTFSVNFVYENVLEPHQQDRINVLFNDNVDLKSEGYNLNQSMIAIGSGGLTGKGFMEGTQTKGGFVPEQHSDYIFTTVGEEWGFFGSFFVILVYVLFFFRLLHLAENQKTVFSRAYGYCVVTILFTHFAVNIMMLIKLFPTIGVPLPFFSYGGSSFWAFTILLFIFLKMDANKVNEWH